MLTVIPGCLTMRSLNLRKYRTLKERMNSLVFGNLEMNCCQRKRFIYSSSGKPSLIDDTTQLSISHSSQSICVAISDFPLGIDIEKNR